MKALRLIFLLLTITLSLTAQTNEPINGFWGLEFGESKVKVKTKLNQYITSEDDESLFFRNVTFGGDRYDDCLITFFKNKLYGGSFSKEIESKDDAIDFIVDLKKKISSKYGNPERTKTDTHLIFGWTDANENYILLGMSETETAGFRVMLMYKQEAIYKEKKKSEINDF